LNASTVNIPLDQLVNITDVIKIPEFNVSINLAMNYTVVEGFETTQGKFSNSLGNVVLIDCKYAKNLFLTSYINIFEDAIKNNPLLYVVLS
jgi:hypothetical protein